MQLSVFSFIFYAFYAYTSTLCSDNLDSWLKKIDETKTPVTKKKEIKYPDVDFSFLSFFIGLIDGDGYIQCRKRLNGYIEFNLVITFQNRDLKTFEYIRNKLKFGKIKRVSDTLSKYVVYNFELKYIL